MRKFLTLVLAVMMIVTSLPVGLLAETDYNYDNLDSNKSDIVNGKLPVEVAKPKNGETAEDLINNPEMPEIYTLRTDYMVKKNGEWKINYQPYVASVGANATPGEQANVKKTISLPDLKGYEKPQESFKITYDIVKNGIDGKDTQDFKYHPKENYISVKHVFQSLTDFNKYGPKDGDTDVIYTTAKGKTGSLLEVTSLPKSSIEGFEPETDILSTIVPEDTSDFEIEYRYHRKDYDVNYDTVDGNAIPSRRLYYGQKIPTVETPTKNGSVFLGWKPSANLVGVLNSVETNFKKDEVIKDANGDPIVDLNAKLKMPAQDITFTAVWKDAPKADYLIQFWTEKTDYDDKDDTLPLRDRYDYIGSRRIEQVDTGLIPDLTNLDIHGITFPDLNDGRLKKAQDDKKEFERYYFLNEDLTKKQNASKEDPNVQKSVLSTGETVYNVYYDRRVYTLYFTAANEEAFENAGSYWPIITRDGKGIGKEGSPYKVDVRFNQSLNKIWPKDEEVSNLPPASSEKGVDIGLIGWIINNNAGELIYRDTPPYRLSAEDFIDAEDVMIEEDYYGFGHSDQIPIGENKTKARDKYEISIGSTSYEKAVVHHIDIIKDDFEGKEQIDYDMSYWKSDTNAVGDNAYPFILPHLQGFTLKENERPAEWIYTKKSSGKDKTFDELNAERNEKTPFRSEPGKDDKIEYIDKFPWGTTSFDGKNAYNYARYSRNSYKLKLNDDPKTIKNDNEYTDGKDRFAVPYEMPLKNLDLDTKYEPQKPTWVPKNWEFKGWATDPAGENLLKKGKETKLNYDQFIFAKWGEPDYKWKVTIDPDGGNLKDIKLDDLIIKEDADKDLTEVATKLPNEGSKQFFDVNHREKLKRLPIPRRKGYDFLGWQLIRYNEDGSVDTSYINEYKVPELYAFGNELVTDVYLKAIWLSNDKIDIPVYHHFLDKDGNEIESLKVEKVIDDARVGYYTAASASEQNQEWLLMPKEELEALADDNPVKIQYKKYNEKHTFNNADYHTLKVEPLKILDTQGKEIDNPNAKDNVFHFYYREFKTRNYKVNYIDERFKGNETAEGAAIIPQELVSNGNRHFDARNYRVIPGWKLVSAPQQQLFFDVDEDTNQLLGINGTGKDEITFYYRDVRVIEVPKDGKTPDGYVRVTFKAEKGGSFGKDAEGNDITELNYDVIKGLKSDLLPVPGDPVEEDKKEKDKYYITPDDGKKFTKWDNKALLNKNTIIDNDTKDFYVFTAYFEWSGLTAKGLVRTEAFKDSENKWTNDFAPTIDQLKAQLVWKEKGDVKPLPTGTVIKLYDENDNELTKDEQVHELVKELNKADKDQLVRTVNVKAKVTFPDKKDPQELDIPVKVYKNVYEALTSGEKPEFLSKAEKGELKDITGDYVKVTVNPTGKPGDKDSKIYYVNKNAWVEIPEIELTAEEKAQLGFTRWTSNNDDVNTNGAYIFEKENVKQRYKFTKDTLIQPDFSKDVVEQEEGKDKPDVPNTFVKVIVTTKEDDVEKATEETKFERTFWVNPTKEVTIQVSEPTGDTAKDDQGNVVKDAAGNDIKWLFKEWSSPLTATFTEKETKINAKYETTVPEPSAEAGLVETYVGREPELDDYEKAIKMMLGESDLSFDKNVSSFEITKDPDVSKPGMSEAKVKVEFNNGQVKEVTVPVKVHANIYPGDNNGDKTSDVPEDYVKVTVNPKAYDEYSQQIKYYYVNPKVKVTIPELVIQDSDKERYGFKKWTTDNKIINLLDPEEVYDFTKEYQFTVDTEIYAFYEKNGEPDINIGFEAKEIVKNIGDKVSVQEYKDALIIPKDAEGKDIAEVKGINILDDPDTSKEGYTTAKIQVVYDDGKTQELIVLVKVLPDYLEQTDPDKKPDVPDNFVKVIVKTKEKVVKDGVETEEERATIDTAFDKTFWVNPLKEVTIDVNKPTGIKDTTDNRTWNFDYWKVDTDDGAEYRNTITDQFTKETTILAKYTKDEVEKPSADDVITEEGVQPSKNDYLDKIDAPDGKTINDIKIIKEPDVSRPGVSTAIIEVEYNDGTKALVDVKVFVQRKNEPQPQPSEPQIIYRDRIVEKEKIVEKIVKIKDNERLKELRYMQGYNGKFRPYDGLRRSEAAQILANALKADGYAYDPYYPISYTDIGDTWYTEAVRIVSQAGVFQGYSDGTFKPEGKITRAEWVATLRRFQDLKKVSGNDMGLSIGHWATEEIEAAYQAGWLDVYTSGIATFDANAPITRQEVAAVSNKAFDRVLDKVYLQRNVKNMINYKDINPSMPLYEDILCASNTLLTDGKYYKANTIILDNLTFNIVTDDLVIYQKKFQYNINR